MTTARLGLLMPLLLLASIVEARPPLADSADVRVRDVTQHESSVFVSPLNPNVVLVVSNAAGASTSTDGGLTWSGNGNHVQADPAAAIIGSATYGSHGRFVAISNPGSACTGGLCANYKDAAGDSWTPASVTEEFGEKPHVAVDNSPFSDAGLRYRYGI